MDHNKCGPVKSERAALAGFEFGGVSTYKSRPTMSPPSSTSTEMTDLDLSAGATLPFAQPSSTSTAGENAYHPENLFLMCHGCTVALVVRLPTTCDLVTPGTLFRLGHGTMMLTTCRGCLRGRAKEAPQRSLGTNELRDLISILRISPRLIEQTHAYQVMKVVSEFKVLIMTQDGGLAYETWENIVDKLPVGSVISMLQTDLSHGLIRSRLILPFVPVNIV